MRSLNPYPPFCSCDFTFSTRFFVFLVNYKSHHSLSLITSINITSYFFNSETLRFFAPYSSPYSTPDSTLLSFILLPIAFHTLSHSPYKLLFTPLKSSPRSVKPHVISLFGDIAMAIEGDFDRYTSIVFGILKQAGE